MKLAHANYLLPLFKKETPFKRANNKDNSWLTGVEGSLTGERTAPMLLTRAQWSVLTGFSAT
jgi:hypothetical protein